MTDTRSIAELAEAAAAEIGRRGWLAGELFDVDSEDWDLREGYDASFVYDDGYENADGVNVYDLPFKQAVLDNCRVCSLGAMRAAFDGRPDRGDRSDGNGYDNFVAAAADRIWPAWRTATYSYDGALPQFRSGHTVVASWNDGDLREDGALGAPSSAFDVINLFKRLAADVKEQS